MGTRSTVIVHHDMLLQAYDFCPCQTSTNKWRYSFRLVLDFFVFIDPFLESCKRLLKYWHLRLYQKSDLATFPESLNEPSKAEFPDSKLFCFMFTIEGITLLSLPVHWEQIVQNFFFKLVGFKIEGYLTFNLQQQYFLLKQNFFLISFTRSVAI